MNTNMDLTRTKNGSIFAIIETILSVIIVYASVLYRANIVSLAFSASFIFLLIFFIRHFVNLNFSRLDMCSAFLIFIIVASLFNMIFSTFDSGASVNFAYLQPFFLFVATLISFHMSLEYGVTKKNRSIFLRSPSHNSHRVSIL